MPQSSSQSQRLASAMDAELRRIERAGLRDSSADAIKLRAEVLRAWLRGGDVFAPIAKYERKLTGSLADAILVAYLQGVVRARAVLDAAHGVSLAKPRTLRQMLASVTNMTRGVSDVQALANRASFVATQNVVDAGSVIRSKVADAVEQAIKSGKTVRSAAPTIQRALDASGVTNSNPYLAQTLYRTSLQESYTAARWQQHQLPEVQEILWGYEYVATLDDRTTDLCSDLDGTRRAKSDPFWATYMPPNHYNCRSAAVEVFNDEVDLASATRVPQVGLPDEGFRENPGEAIFGT